MASELALIEILRSDATIQGLCGNPARVYPMRAAQKAAFPRIIVRKLPGAEPHDTKDGPSELDFERVQVLVEDDEFNTDTYAVADRIRTLCDRPAEGAYNGVYLESSAFEDDDQFEDGLVDQTIYSIEHIYKTMVRRVP